MGEWERIKLPTHGLMLSHICFANDILHFGEAIDIQAHLIENILSSFYKMSGPKLNLSKLTSHIICH